MKLASIRIFCIVTVLFFLMPLSAHAESIKGVKLGDSIKAAISAFGRPAMEKSLKNGEKKYLWGRKHDLMVIVHSRADVITYLHCNTSIRCTAENPAYRTEKGVAIGAPVESVTKKYGKGRNDYAYPSEDCFVENYKISPKEMLIFRSYGFNPRGAVIIDIVLCDPSFPAAEIWKETTDR